MLGSAGIARLGLVQMALGSVVVVFLLAARLASFVFGPARQPALEPTPEWGAPE